MFVAVTCAEPEMRNPPADPPVAEYVYVPQSVGSGISPAFPATKFAMLTYDSASKNTGNKISTKNPASNPQLKRDTR